MRVAAVLLALFLLAERTQFHLEIRRQTWSFSLTEIPLVIGLFEGSPATVLLSRLGACALLFAWRRLPPVKAVFNLVLFATEVVVAEHVFVAFRDADVTHPISWLAGLAAVLAMSVVGAFGVYVVISLSGSAPDAATTLGMLAQIALLTPFTTSLGILTFYLYRSQPTIIILWAMLVGVTLLGYRAYARSLRQRKTLQHVYEFGRLVEESRAVDIPVGPVVERIRELLNARRAVLGLRAQDDPDEQIRTVTTGDAQGSGTDPHPDAITAAALSGSGASLVTARAADAEQREALSLRGAREVIAAPLRSGNDVLGYIEVIDRQSARQSFIAEDVRLLESLASHLAAGVENQRLVERLRHEAYHDQLTGLPNRAQFLAAVETAINASDARGVVGVVLFGLNSMKEVTDSLGRDAGDRVVTAVAKRFAEQLPKDSTVARVGPDVFGLLLRAPDVAVLTERARTLHALLFAPCEVSGITIEMGLSVGVAAWPTHASEAGTLLQRADVAIDAARNTGHPVAAYLASMDHSSLHRLQLVTDLRSALAAGQISLRYQPKVALGGKELVGVEALVRWDHPHHGEISPEEFVPLAERTGLIGVLTTHVLATALRQCRTWLDRGARIGVAVNLSVRSLLDSDFADQVTELLGDTEVPAELLTFEITENNVMSDPERALPVLHRLHELGIGLSVDDFGTGYSSLAYLRRLPVDEVKIDKSFVLGMGTDLGDHAIVRAIIELCHSLGLRVVAEGVEEEMARDMLNGMDCDVVQGYLVGRPMTVARLEAWFTARTVSRPEGAGGAGLLGRGLRIERDGSGFRPGRPPV